MILKELSKAEDKLSFVKENKAEILAEKKAMAIKYSDPIGYPVDYLSAITKGATIKSIDGILNVEVIGNVTNFMDSQYDVLLPKSYNKTLSDNRPERFKFLKDHDHSTDGVIGTVTGASVRKMNAQDFGYADDIKMEALVFEAQIKEYYDKKLYEMYAADGVDQHSIGLKYVQIALAVNDEDMKEDYSLWKKHIKNIINRDEAEKAGFFFAITEIKLFENSAVLWGANPLTPTLTTAADKDHSDLKNLLIKNLKDGI